MLWVILIRWGKIGQNQLRQAGQNWLLFLINRGLSKFAEIFRRSLETLPAIFFLKIMDFKNRIFGGAKLDFSSVKHRKIVEFQKKKCGVSIAFLYTCIYNFHLEKNIFNRKLKIGQLCPTMSELPTLKYFFKFKINLIYSIH